MVYACFVAKMSKMAFTRFGGQFQFEKSNGGQVRQFLGRASRSAQICNPTPRKALFVGPLVTFFTPSNANARMCVRFWVTQPERPKGAKDEVKEA